MPKCDYCLKEFKRHQYVLKHQKICSYRKSPKIKVKDTTNEMFSILINQNKKIAEELHHIKNKPYQQINNTINNVNNVNNVNNIIITEKLPECFYNALVDKLGKTKAINLLNLSSASNSAINIYKELYPSKKILDNPVIYQDNTFKYLEGNEVISDNRIISQIAKQIQTAMLYASSNLITESIKINKTDQLYDIYDIGKIQTNVRNTGLIEKQVSGYIKLELIN